MSLFTQDESKALLSKVLSFSKADECQVSLGGSDGGNIRYARNSVSTSGSVSSTQLQIASSFGKKQGITTINEYDDASLEKAVRRAEAIAQLAPENPEHMPVLGPQTYAAAAKTFSPETAAMSTKVRADLVEQSLAVARDAGVTAAGYLENSANSSALMNSRGLFAYGTGTNVNFSITMRTNDGGGSGYASGGYNNLTDLDVVAASKTAAWKAAKSGGAKALEPGKYTVILEPAAGIVLLENLYGALDARNADEGRSFLSLPGGKTRLGEKLVDEQVNIYSDPFNPDLPSSTWNREGQPMEKR
ncbi:MAG TPA: metallopeptidase TldD-related protein, partial [Puia sp.]